MCKIEQPILFQAILANKLTFKWQMHALTYTRQCEHSSKSLWLYQPQWLFEMWPNRI